MNAQPKIESDTPLYWRTQYGSLCERQAGPDSDGWMTLLRLDDGAIRHFHVDQLTPVSNEDAIAEAKAALVQS